jgi:type IV pilus assembly protein PilE
VKCADYKKPKIKNGYTLVEVCIAMVIICILAAMAAPIYTKAIEQARLDSAAGNLKTIWSAQRAYWLKNHTFAASLTTLEDEDLISSSLARTQIDPNSIYVYDIDSAGISSFAASATRSGSGVWSGQIQVDELGELSGQISKDDGFTLSPLTLE